MFHNIINSLIPYQIIYLLQWDIEVFYLFMKTSTALIYFILLFEISYIIYYTSLNVKGLTFFDKLFMSDNGYTLWLPIAVIAYIHYFWTEYHAMFPTPEDEDEKKKKKAKKVPRRRKVSKQNLPEADLILENDLKQVVNTVVWAFNAEGEFIGDQLAIVEDQAISEDVKNVEENQNFENEIVAPEEDWEYYTFFDFDEDQAISEDVKNVEENQNFENEIVAPEQDWEWEYYAIWDFDEDGKFIGDLQDDFGDISDEEIPVGSSLEEERWSREDAAYWKEFWSDFWRRKL